MTAQAASLVLTTTPAESLAMGLRTALQPLRLLGVPVQVGCLLGAHCCITQQPDQQALGRAALQSCKMFAVLSASPPALPPTRGCPAPQNPPGPAEARIADRAGSRCSSLLCCSGVAHASVWQHPALCGAQEITLTLLLSLRCLGLVFEDVRNLVLGLAVRGIDWSQTNALLVRTSPAAACLRGRLAIALPAGAHESLNHTTVRLVRNSQVPGAVQTAFRAGHLLAATPNLPAPMLLIRTMQVVCTSASCQLKAVTGLASCVHIPVGPFSDSYTLTLRAGGVAPGQPAAQEAGAAQREHGRGHARPRLWRRARAQHPPCGAAQYGPGAAGSLRQPGRRRPGVLAAVRPLTGRVARGCAAKTWADCSEVCAHSCCRQGAQVPSPAQVQCVHRQKVRQACTRTVQGPEARPPAEPQGGQSRLPRTDRAG